MAEVHSTVGEFALSAVNGRLIFANAEINGNIWMLDQRDQKLTTPGYSHAESLGPLKDLI